jgi:methionyl-tRNA formyltransferase
VRLVYLGSPPFATPVLERLLASSFRPGLIVTPPPRRQGRGRTQAENPVADLARAADIDCLQPESVSDPEFLERLRAVEADVFLVVSYGELLRQEFLDIPRVVNLNVHPSLLPRWRGASPIQAAIRAGDEETGVSIQKVVLALDAGDVLAVRRCAILPGETAGELAGRLAELSGELVIEALQSVADGKPEYTAQDPAGVTQCKRIQKEDGLIDWTRDAVEIDRQVRALNPWPGAFTFAAGKKLAVWSAQVLPLGETGAPGTVLSATERLTVACGRGALELTQVQVAGKRALAVGDFLRGTRLDVSSLFGEES